MFRSRKLFLFDLLCILIATACFCSYAIWNGYPLVFLDTGTYVASGFERFVPRDRPLAYGFFIRHSSLAHSE
jgi:hypothetical protein